MVRARAFCARRVSGQSEAQSLDEALRDAKLGMLRTKGAAPTVLLGDLATLLTSNFPLYVVHRPKAMFMAVANGLSLPPPQGESVFKASPSTHDP